MIWRANHVRYARNTQLARLTGFDPSSFSIWTHSPTWRMTGEIQELIARKLCMDKVEFIRGFEERRQDAAVSRAFQAEIYQVNPEQ